MTRSILQLNDIADLFDGVLIDQFGVLHDGQEAFPGAIDCLESLSERGIPMVALTNSGKRAALNAKRLERLGFPKHLFRAVVSSGELAHCRIGEMLATGILRRGDPVVILSRDGDQSMVDGHELQRVAPEAGAKLLIIAGVEPESRTRASYRDALAPLAAQRVPALCINPDLQIYANGAPAFGPGLVARDYKEAGGEVAMLGKPGKEMFAAGLAALGTDAARTLMIGDSPEHDIAGAKALGCRTLLIKGGVQSDESGASAEFNIPRLL